MYHMYVYYVARKGKTHPRFQCAPRLIMIRACLSPLKPGLLTLLPWYVWSKEFRVQYGTVSILSLDIQMNILANGIDSYNNMHMEYCT